MAHNHARVAGEDFIVTISKWQDLSVGLGVTCPGKKYVYVKSVKEKGLIAIWNEANPVASQVHSGDTIIIIDGATEDTGLMMQALRDGVADGKKVEMTVRRTHTSAAAVEAAAAEARDHWEPEGPVKAPVQEADEGSPAEAPTRTEALLPMDPLCAEDEMVEQQMDSGEKDAPAEKICGCAW